MALTAHSTSHIANLRRFRRRTWALIALCAALRMTAALTGVDLSQPVSAFATACPVHPETLSC